VTNIADTAHLIWAAFQKTKKSSVAANRTVSFVKRPNTENGLRQLNNFGWDKPLY